MIQAHIFGVFKIFFDMPPASNGMDHLLECRRGWSEDEGVTEVCCIGHAATEQEPMLSIRLPVMQDGYTGPVKQAGTFGSFAHREALPRLLRQQERWHVGDMHESASP